MVTPWWPLSKVPWWHLSEPSHRTQERRLSSSSGLNHTQSASPRQEGDRQEQGQKGETCGQHQGLLRSILHATVGFKFMQNVPKSWEAGSTQDLWVLK